MPLHDLHRPLHRQPNVIAHPVLGFLLYRLQPLVGADIVADVDGGGYFGSKKVGAPEAIKDGTDESIIRDSLWRNSVVFVIKLIAVLQSVLLCQHFQPFSQIVTIGQWGIRV